LSRRLVQLTEMICLVTAFGCATSETGPGGPPASAGASSGDVGGTAGQSGTPTGGTTGSAGGAPAAGEANVGTGGASSSATGGAATAMGGATATTPLVPLVMTWVRGATSNDSSEVDVKLPAGAANVLTSTIKITLCGQGNVPMILATDLTFDQATLICPGTATPADCQYGQNYPFNDAATGMTVSVTGTALNCCYVIDLSKVNHSLAPGGMIKLVYRFNQDVSVIGLNYTHGATWSALVNGQTSASCKLGDWPSTTITCI